ncbi:hypothetical protein M433DRAFT_6432 [Acidomyces richmondensis BFW]|nr:hypothetical protein M433DRAFT_6432 [Acidomyces richmondensis BFW]
MVGLRTIDRTAVFAWSPGTAAPLLVTGTRAGAVSEDFSDETKLELWDLGLDKPGNKGDLKPAGNITTDSGFNDISWSEPNEQYPLGVIAGALENGSVDLWDAKKLRDGDSSAHISRTTKHSGPVKALQWNPYRHNLLASVGAKGEIYLYDLNDMAKATRLGATAARADDIECLDWNKQEKNAHILAVGSSGGFVTVWDVKGRKDILTLNNQGRKAVSAVAWDPEESTKLATATPNDQEPAIYLWSLRNSSAPERTLKGHELGVLGLSWCRQDPDLLLSCGKDNRTICWNPRTGEKYGDFVAGSNWAFQTRWNPHNPDLVASASFDGKIVITSIQATNSKLEDQAASNEALDGEDFFARAQAQPQSISFNLPKAPKWAGRPVSVSFGFGGKLVRLSQDASKKSKVTIDTFEVDSSIGEAAVKFEEKLKSGDLAAICESKIQNAKTDEEKADWRVIETLNAGKSRKKLREYMGFAGEDAELEKGNEKLDINGDSAKPATNGENDGFFDNGDDDDDFLANLAATKGAKTNNPFKIYTDSESEVDKSITQAVILGQFENACDVCLKEDRIADAFMIAVCGGQKCIDKVQNAYLKKKAKGPNYLRLLASIVGKNLWDVVYNADLQNWKEAMATLCTYADETEFADLCEALGDRLEEEFKSGDESKNLRRDASFCYLAGSKLEKVVSNWVEELQEQEKAALESSESENDFSVHAKCLQDFIEKVSVFRKVTNFHDAEMQATADWKLAPLYALYAEYADILASHGQLAAAEEYLDLLPSKFGGAEAAQQRVRNATMKAGATLNVAQRQTATTNRRPPSVTPGAAPLNFQPQQPLINQARNAPSPYAPATPFNATAQTSAPAGPYGPASNPYAPAGYQSPQQPGTYGQPAGYGGYQPPPQQATLAPPPRAGTTSPSAPPPSQVKTGDWNDMPANFIKERQPNSRRATPGPTPISSPFPNAQPNLVAPPPTGSPQFGQQRPTPQLPPPPKAGELPSRVTSPPTGPPQSVQRPGSSAYVPAALPSQTLPGSTLPMPTAPPVPRGTSPYQPPPSTSTGAPSNRYAPAPGSQSSPAPGAVPPQRQVAPNPYSMQQQKANPYTPAMPPKPAYGQPPQAHAPPPSVGPPPRGPPRGGPPPSAASSGPPPRGTPISGGSTPPVQPLPQMAADANANTTTSPSTSAPQARKYPKGDRSHIPASAQPILDILTPIMTQIKNAAPAAFKPQVDDMEKRINILYDHLNNQDLLKEDTVKQMVEIAECVQGKDFDRALSLFGELQTAKQENEGGVWMVGVKRLINLSKATNR